jgi:molybdopterin converting factor small subunit
MHIQVEIFPWFSKYIDPMQHGRLLLKEELCPGASLRALLSQLAERYTGFAECIYDTQSDRLHGQVVITHNGRLLTPLTNLDLPLHDGDSVGFIPVYAGG